jgi:hypothetical protein
MHDLRSDAFSIGQSANVVGALADEASWQAVRGNVKAFRFEPLSAGGGLLVLEWQEITVAPRLTPGCPNTMFEHRSNSNG